MANLDVIVHHYDFSPVRNAMRRYVDSDILPCVAHAVLRGQDLLEIGCTGWADREQRIPLRLDHLYRVFSNTKLVTSCAALLLVEDDSLHLDDPVERWLPELANRQVLRPGATDITDTKPAKSRMTVRQLMSHSAGFSYGALDPGTLIYNAYQHAEVNHPSKTLAQMVTTLSDLPLVYHPGESWEYSVATDVLSRVIEVVSGQAFDEFLQARIFKPLGMHDTMFFLPQELRERLCVLYSGTDVSDPMRPGLAVYDYPFPGAYLQPVPKLSGGAGLLSTLPDMITLMRALLPGGTPLLKPNTVALLTENQLAPGVHLRFPPLGEVPGKVHGLVGALTLTPSPFEPPEVVGEISWGGVAGTHWWISPSTGVAGLLMTQRHMGFWHPYSFEFKKLVFDALRTDATSSYKSFMRSDQ